jgi:proteic killer suppression protein
VIRKFRCRDTERLFETGRSKRFAGIATVASRKLDMLDAAQNLDDLRRPPANRLEALKGNRKGQYGIRVNDRWRICFRRTSDGAEAVEIIDYH